MRMMMKLRMIDTERASAAIQDGSMGQLIQATMERLQPEAAYFGPEDGVRTAFLFFDLKDTSDIPVIAEPLFQNMRARLTWIPFMT